MASTDPRSLRPLRIVLWVLVAVAAFALAWFQLISPRLQVLSESGTDNMGRGEYQLIASDGSTFTQDSLKGQPSAVFFGFTHCPDVCPTTLGEVAGWQEEVAKKGQSLRVFFVTVDPERDTPEVIKDYVSWVPGVIGVSGSPEEVGKAIKAFRVYARKVPGENGDYSMDHSAMTLLFDKDGRYSGLIGYQEAPERVQANLAKLVE
ncbi:SCO family protein [Paracoccus sp. CPCC 101403]|uniref:SCO family protein n=2 Tax=Paracoccus broussonetiae TaxID=3075834 RepID=A0ABU3EFI3_9RHOB|nr:SCO family protein [Paracoccus sp. CPCC 101403]MDT1063003.1 SCO family protein [Paracoccus sp. CPCC 101403]